MSQFQKRFQGKLEYMPKNGIHSIVAEADKPIVPIKQKIITPSRSPNGHLMKNIGPNVQLQSHIVVNPGEHYIENRSASLQRIPEIYKNDDDTQSIRNFMVPSNQRSIKYQNQAMQEEVQQEYIPSFLVNKLDENNFYTPSIGGPAERKFKIKIGNTDQNIFNTKNSAPNVALQQKPGRLLFQQVPQQTDNSRSLSANNNNKQVDKQQFQQKKMQFYKKIYKKKNSQTADVIHQPAKMLNLYQKKNNNNNLMRYQVPNAKLQGSIKEEDNENETIENKHRNLLLEIEQLTKLQNQKKKTQRF